MIQNKIFLDLPLRPFEALGFFCYWISYLLDSALEATGQHPHMILRSDVLPIPKDRRVKTGYEVLQAVVGVANPDAH